jgi:hypothetical protein
MSEPTRACRKPPFANSLSWSCRLAGIRAATETLGRQCAMLSAALFSCVKNAAPCQLSTTKRITATADRALTEGRRDTFELTCTQREVLNLPCRSTRQCESPNRTRAFYFVLSRAYKMVPAL